MNAISNNIRWQDYVFSCLSDCLSVWKKGEDLTKKMPRTHNIKKLHLLCRQYNTHTPSLSVFLVWFDRSCSHVACFFIILFSFFADFTTQSQWRCLACLFCLLRFFFIVRLCVTFFWSGTMIVSLLPGHSLFPFHYLFFSSVRCNAFPFCRYFCLLQRNSNACISAVWYYFICSM